MGDSFDLVGGSGQVWGQAVLTGKGTTNPVFVSVGHKISMETATALTLAVSHTRIPEPVRQVKGVGGALPAGWAGHCQQGGRGTASRVGGALPAGWVGALPAGRGTIYVRVCVCVKHAG